MKIFPIIDKQTLADKLENRLSHFIEGSPIEAPLLVDIHKALTNKWYRLSLSGGKSGDGSEYHIYIKTGSRPDNGPLCIFFSGGGMAWDEKTAGSPITAGTRAGGEGGYYWSNLRPVTQLMNIGMGITDPNIRRNPFHDWNFVVITYSTGDFHVGDSEYRYRDEEGDEKILYFHGYQNFHAAMEETVSVFKNPEKMLIAGDSAGGFGVAALTGEICAKWYPNCRDITVLSDSSYLEKADAAAVMKDVWNTPYEIRHSIKGGDMIADWYENLYDIMGNRIKYLFAGSEHDCVLSCYMNAVACGEFKTDDKIQKKYARKFVGLLKKLKEINPEFGIFLYNWKDKIHGNGGTVHTAVRTPFFYVPDNNKDSFCNWLYDAVNGKVRDYQYNVGPLDMDLLWKNRI